MEEIELMKVKVLVISGSPRKSANTDYIAKVALQAASEALPGEVETEFYSIAGKKYRGCISCFKCVELKGECCIKDDFQELRDKWIEADVVLYALPIYHLSIPGQLKCFIDRLGNTIFSYYSAIPCPLKVIGCIAQGVHIFSGQELTMTAIINHALVMGCIPISGDAPESYIGVGGWTANDLSKDALEKLVNKEELDAVMTIKATKSMAKRAVQLAMMIKVGALNYKEKFEADHGLKPLYDRIK